MSRRRPIETVQFACHACGSELRVATGLAGRIVACHGCQARLIVPDGPRTATPPAPGLRKVTSQTPFRWEL